MYQVNPLLAKLLAKENLTVEHGNYQTAWFDVKNRVLGLPIWKDKGKDVYDLLVGHEVGHALYTPLEGLHSSNEEIKGCPRGYINVVEDARIEKMIQSAYPGLVRTFKSGYNTLFKDGFFRHNHNFEMMKLIDKINLKSKLNNLIDVPFNDKELELFNETMNTKTFSDVCVVVKKIFDYDQSIKKQSEVDSNDSSSEGDNDQSEENSNDSFTEAEETTSDDSNEEEKDSNGNSKVEETTSDDDTKAEEKDSNGNINEEEKDSNGNSNEEETTSDDDTKAEEKDSNINSKVEETTSDDDDDDINKEIDSGGTDDLNKEISDTDEFFRSKEKELVDLDENGCQTILINEYNNSEIDQLVISYDELAKDRKKVMAESRWHKTEAKYNIRESCNKYIKDVKKAIRPAVKEFEMKKAAYRYQRATTSNTGSINVDKLHSYKYDDNIFASVTQMADAKNHGLMIIIDYSSSMGSTLANVVQQTLHLICFCKAVNIPFEVYSFTTSYHRQSLDIRFNTMYHDNMSLVQLISSNLNKTDYEEALHHLCLRVYSAGLIETLRSWDFHYTKYTSKLYEDFGTTPLNQSLIICDNLAKKFINKHKIQKFNFITITDGESNRLRSTPRPLDDLNKYVQSPKLNTHIKINIDNKILTSKINKSSSSDITTTLLSHIREKYNANTIGFFITDSSSSFSRCIKDAIHIKNKNNTSDSLTIIKEKDKEYAKNKCVEFNDIYGYNTYYILKKGKNLNTDMKSFKSNDKKPSWAQKPKASLAQNFREYSKSKKTNKVLMQKIGGAVA